jgi:3-hydroxyisobutyrate dehydrogenase
MTNSPKDSAQEMLFNQGAPFNIAFLGLGVMGAAMARHLAAKGHKITVYNRTRAKAEAWLKSHSQYFASATLADTPQAAAKGQDMVLACVGNDEDVRAITIGPNGAFGGMSRGTVFIDHTTTSAELARDMAKEAAARGLHFIDAPVSGGQSGAENGTLTVMCGGDADIYKRAEPVILSFATSCRLMGGHGAGQLTKMVNQICIAGLIEALAEGLHFAQQAGLDGLKVLEVISKGAAGSWQMDNRGSTMCEGTFDFGFAVDWMRKDLGFCLDEARKNGARLPITAIIDQFYADVQAAGGGRLDTSSLITRLTAGAKRP